MQNRKPQEQILAEQVDKKLDQKNARAQEVKGLPASSMLAMMRLMRQHDALAAQSREFLGAKLKGLDGTMVKGLSEIEKLVTDKLNQQSPEEKAVNDELGQVHAQMHENHEQMHQFQAVESNVAAISRLSGNAVENVNGAREAFANQRTTLFAVHGVAHSENRQDAKADANNDEEHRSSMNMSGSF